MFVGEDQGDVKQRFGYIVQKRRVQFVEVVKVIVFFFSDDVLFVIGVVYNVDGGWVCQIVEDQEVGFGIINGVFLV